MIRATRSIAVLLALVLVVAACTSTTGNDPSAGDGPAGTTRTIDHQAIGLWDDGPCDAAKPPVKIGLMTVFESPVLSLKDQATALEASATAFNARGGANGSCLEVIKCDDGANPDKAVGCVRELDQAGVVATINDQGTVAHAEVSQAMAAAKIPRIASNVTNNDWGDPNAYPLDASGTGVTFLLPQALVESGVSEIGIIRVDLASGSRLRGIVEGIYEGDATFPADLPVPGGTTDFSQFILAAQSAGAGGVTLLLGEQEAVQVVKAGQQLGTDLLIGSSLGSFSHSSVAAFDDFAGQMVFLWSFPPATTELPIYEALRADLAASGERSLQVENLRASPMRSWIGLYAFLKMARDAKTTEFTRDGVTAMLQQAKDVPMLDMFGGENWTPNLNHPGLFKRAGTNFWATYKWDASATGPNGLTGNFVRSSEFSFDDVLCGSLFGAPGPC
jgi:ABC-type branched-subunit amino acid transport system substrate-binding protein